MLAVKRTSFGGETRTVASIFLVAKELQLPPYPPNYRSGCGMLRCRYVVGPILQERLDGTKVTSREFQGQRSARSATRTSNLEFCSLQPPVLREELKHMAGCALAPESNHTLWVRAFWMGKSLEFDDQPYPKILRYDLFS